MSRVQPWPGCRFLVDLGDGSDPWLPDAGFSEVVLPPVVVEESAGTPEAQRLLLRRGATGTLNLYTWCQQAMQGQAAPRDVVVTLLAEDLRTTVLTWRFRNARPVTLYWSPLDANSDELLVETLEVAYDRFELH